MARNLQRDFGVPVRWVEDRSLTSRENARNSAPMLKAAAAEAHPKLGTRALPRGGLQARSSGLSPCGTPGAR